MTGQKLIERRVKLLTLVENEDNKKKFIQFLEGSEIDLPTHSNFISREYLAEKPEKAIQKMDEDQVEEAIDHIKERT